MKDKVLRSAVTEAVEKLTRALRNYTDEPMSCFLSVFTRDEEIKADGEPDTIPDSYSVTVRSGCVEPGSDPTLRMMCKIYYSDDEFGQESIRTVIPCHDEGEEDES